MTEFQLLNELLTRPLDNAVIYQPAGLLLKGIVYVIWSLWPV
jgi:hypothetical protein